MLSPDVSGMVSRLLGKPFRGGLSRPHQVDVDQDGNVYIANWDGGWMNKFVPKPGADPSKLMGRPLVLAR